jgi:CBS domain containing-hemolysin-like protein
VGRVPVLVPPGLLAALGATLVGQLVLGAVLLAAEGLALFGTLLVTALEHHSRSGVLALAERAGARDRIEARLARAPSYLITGRLARFLGNSVLVVGMAWLFLADHFRGGDPAPGLPWGAIGAILVLSFVLCFLVNDVAVRVLASRAPDAALLRALGVVDPVHGLLAPIRWPMVALVALLFRVRLDAAAPGAREEILETVEEGEREGSFTPEEAGMVESIMGMHGRIVRDVMVPRADLVMIPASTSLDRAVALVNEEGYSRIPVFERDRDDVVGILYARDLLAHWASAPTATGGAPVRTLMRKPFFVPESKPVTDLLQEMRAKKVHMAVVLDQFNGTAGAVTIEDLLEEIVGEIQDEYDDEEEAAERPPQAPGAARALQVEGRLPIEEVNRMLGLDLPVEEGFETVSGLVFHRLGRVPVAGDEVRVGLALLKVLEADARTAQRVEVAKADAVPDASRR